MIELKELQSEDFDQIKDLFRSVFMAPPWNDDWSDENQLDLYLHEIMDVPLSLNYGLYVDEKLVGISLGKIKHWCGGTEYFIEELCIKTDMQSKGLGSKFMNLIENNIIKKDVQQIFLITQRTVPAYSFYKKKGFHEIEEHASMFKELKKENKSFSSEPDVPDCGCIYG